MWEHMGVYNPVTGVSETFVTKGYFASFLLFEILMTFILISLFSFHFFFPDLPVFVLVGLDFLFFVNE